MIEGEGGPPRTVEALETRVVWATGGQEALLNIGPPLSSEGKVLSSLKGATHKNNKDPNS